MKGYGLDLSSYADVKARAPEIYEALANGSMPCDEAWPKERLDEVVLAMVDARSLEELGLGEDRPA